MAPGNSANQPLQGHAGGVSNTTTYADLIAPLNAQLRGGFVGTGAAQHRSRQEAQQQASADDLEGVKLAIEAEVATDYFTLRALDADTELLASNIDVFGRSLELTQNHRTGEIASDLDVAQAETVLRTTQAEFAGRRNCSGRNLNTRWPVFTGSSPPSAFTVPETDHSTSSPPVISAWSALPTFGTQAGHCGCRTADGGGQRKHRRGEGRILTGDPTERVRARHGKPASGFVVRLAEPILVAPGHR